MTLDSTLTTIEIENGFLDFRTKARALALKAVPPEDIIWVEPKAVADTNLSMFSTGAFGPLGSAEVAVRSPLNRRGQSIKPVDQVSVSPDFFRLAEAVAHSNSPGKWSLLYRLLWRLTYENKRLLEVITDDDVKAALDIQKKIKREVHKIHAFVRFECVKDDSNPSGERYVAWMKTDHPCLQLAAPFFMRRFGDRPFSILTPFECAHWDLEKLTYTEGAPVAPARGESVDDLWKSYYKSSVNPARLNIPMMKKEMPVRYWNALPEADIIRDLIQEVPERLKKMAKNQNVRAIPPQSTDLAVLETAAKACTACPLYKIGTHMVFGEGARNARIMIIGEQPGDTEDLEGKPFRGPAGKVLDRALLASGIDRSDIYVTNAVKHFKWKPTDIQNSQSPTAKTRLHQRASGSEMHACKPWLEKEIEAVRPHVIVCLGATAAQAIFGKVCKISDYKGKLITDLPWAPNVLVSYHPSAILRAMDKDEANAMEENMRKALAFARDLTDSP